MTGTDDEPGINGGLLPRPVPAPAARHGTYAFVCTIVVHDDDAPERRIRCILDAGDHVALPKMGCPAWPGRATT